MFENRCLNLNSKKSYLGDLKLTWNMTSGWHYLMSLASLVLTCKLN